MVEAAPEQRRKLFDCPRLAPPRWREAIASLSVWQRPSHSRWSVLTQRGCEQPHEFPARCLHVVLAAADRGHGCMAEEDQADNDRSGWHQHL